MRQMSTKTVDAERATVLQIGIDNIAALEDLFGTDLTADVSETVLQRLARAAPPGAVVQQPDPWRFTLEMPEMALEAAESLARTLQATAARSAVETDLGPVGVTLGIGCASGPAEAGAGTVADAARDALRQARSRGTGAFCFAEDMAARQERRAILSKAARAAMGAVQDHSLTVAYQPIVRADATATPAFHECLVRIEIEDGQLVPAAKFMPAIERLGLAPLIDRRVLDMAFTTLAEIPGTRLSINVFPQTMQDAHWLGIFRDQVAERPDLADRLIIEITETGAMLDRQRTRRFMDIVRDTGAAFAIDDFGAGHTSFRNLRAFRFDMVKLDGAFIENIETDLDDRFFVRLLGDVAERFEMMAVAEAVRRPAQARILRDLGIEYFQGFHFGAPSPRLGQPVQAPRPAIAQV